MRRLACFSAVLALVAGFGGCALSDEAGDGSIEGGTLQQGLTVLSHTDKSINLAYRQADVVIYMQAKRGQQAPELYLFDTNSPPYEIDTRFTDANGFTFYIQQGGHGWRDAEWGKALGRQNAGQNPLVGSNEVLFRVATQAAATLHEDITRQLGAAQAATLAPEIDSIHTYAAKAHEQYRIQYDVRQRELRAEGLEEMPPLSETTGEITYGTPGPDDNFYNYSSAATYSISLHADKLDGIPGYAGGYHSATARHAWAGGSIYWSHSTNNHGRAAADMTLRSQSGSKAFAANTLKAYHCSGEYKWDSDGGDHGHNCHDDSRVQMHNFRYVSTLHGYYRWCDGDDDDHDISVDILFVELDQDGYPSYSTSTNKGYGSSSTTTNGGGVCDYTSGCPSNWMGAGDGCDCNSDGSVCGDSDCKGDDASTDVAAPDAPAPVAADTAPAAAAVVCEYTYGCPDYYMGAGDGCDCNTDGSACGDPDCN